MPLIAITGCSSGFGRVSALRFLRGGWDVIATVRREEDESSLAAEARGLSPTGRLTIVRADITKSGDVARIAQAVGLHGGSLEVLINNAGTAYPGPLELLPVEDLRAQLDINVVAQHAVTQALLPALKAARGRIVFISSISGRVAPPFIGAYGASKFALEAMGDALRVELAPFGVQIVMVEPGSSPTKIWATSKRHAEGQHLENTPYAPLATVFRDRSAKESAAGFSPEALAALLWSIAHAKRPRTRYLIPAGLRWLTLFKAVSTDRFLDRQIRRLLRW
jgi:NAD(P)-dependent dehydrogenase (short-subunit alcohol dehydrogenase family)